MTFLDVLGKTWSATAQLQVVHFTGGMETVDFVAVLLYVGAIQQQMNPLWKWLTLVPLVALLPN